MSIKSCFSSSAISGSFNSIGDLKHHFFPVDTIYYGCKVFQHNIAVFFSNIVRLSILTFQQNR